MGFDTPTPPLLSAKFFIRLENNEIEFMDGAVDGEIVDSIFQVVARNSPPMEHTLIPIIAIFGIFTNPASAATDFLTGDISAAGNWTNGLPGAGNVGTIAVDGTNAATVFGYGAGSTTHLTAGTITSSDGFNLTSGHWKVSGGKILTRYFLSNGSGSIINLSGGTIELNDVASTQHMGTGNGGVLNISGSAVLDGTQATIAIQTGGAIDFASS